MERVEVGRILIVDDEAVGRAALGDLLRAEGWEVELAADGFKALGKLAPFAPDVVLTDLRMPGMDGLELLRKIRAHDGETGDDTVVVVMTAFGSVPSAVEAIKEGAVEYLAKPIDVPSLLRVLGRERERRRLRRQA